jgi:hypothetical protein
MKLKSAALAVLLFVAQIASAASALEIIGSAYRADVPFPQYLHLWSEGWSLRDQSGEPLQWASTNMPLGAYVHLYIHNTSSNAILITDVKLEGVSLKAAIAFGDKEVDRMVPASIHFSKLPKADLDRLIAAGEPVWWKVEPNTVAPGGYAEVTVRLRRQVQVPLTPALSPSDGERVADRTGEGFANSKRTRPTLQTLALQVRAENTSWDARVSTAATPRFMGISFSPSLDTIFGYVQHPQRPGTAPVKVLLDGADVTTRSTLAADPSASVAPLVIHLAQPLQRASFRCLQAVYADGSSALAATRAWGDEPVYGMWGYINHGKTPKERVDYYLGDLQRHNINAVMESYGGEVGEYLSGETGIEHSRTTGIRAMRNKPGPVLNPVYYFLTDEPDAHDFAVSQLQPNQRLGSLAQDLVRRGEEFRRKDPAPPQMLNLDNTFKPENWYMYAQLPDVCCADPYYQEQQNIVWNDRPFWAPSFIRPLYVLGAATICNSACAPKPLHIILNCVQHKTKNGGFRFATPPEKTVELFYALGAGTKSFSYWWYTPYGEFYGCGADDKEAVVLWRQMGLLGAQVRTLGPVLSRSCPASVPLKAPAKLWTRCLLAGTDTLVLLAVNDDIANDRLGSVVVPLQKTHVTITQPAWLKAADAFEITPQGLEDVKWKNDAGHVSLDLGKTEVARMIVLTSDNGLRRQLDELYRTRFAANVAKLLGG